MFTEKTFSTLVTVTNLAWRFGVSHFHYIHRGTGKKKEFYLETCFNAAKLNLVRFTLFVDILYLVFIAGRVFQQVLNDSANLGFLVKMSYLFSAYLLPVVLQYNTVLKFHETPHFLVKYIAFYRDMRNKYLLPDEKGAKCRKFFFVFIFVGFSINLQNVAILMLKPFQPHLLTSILDDPKKASIILRLPLWLAHFFIWASVWTNMWLYCFHWFTYITCSLFLIKELDIRVKSPRTTQNLREPTTCLKVLRSMQVLHRLWEITFQHWMCPSHKAVVCSIASLALYGSVKLRGPRAIIMGFVNIIALLYLSTLFYKFGQLHERSKKLIRNWKTAPDTSKRVKKIILSIPEFGVKIGRFYCVQRTTVINVLWNVLNNTITLFFI